MGTGRGSPSGEPSGGGETWDIPAAQAPQDREDAANWARDLGLPRRVFVLSPGELKPIYIDFASPVLTRILCRQVRRAAADFPGQPVRFTEMLPAPGDCWLADQDGRRYTSEMRLVAVDLGRKASSRPKSPPPSYTNGHFPDGNN